jgi:hypothetical protein
MFRPAMQPARFALAAQARKFIDPKFESGLPATAAVKATCRAVLPI